tara:strand:+ start:52 stop:222 length:171 start_codon:yes stop_codon:yes gene_type:complete
MLITVLRLALQIRRRLSTTENREQVLLRLKDALADGYFSSIEWTKLGKALGVFDKN